MNAPITSSPAVTTVIVTYNSRDTIGPTLDAARPIRDAGLAECIVVDNISRDGTREFVRAEYPWVTLVESPGNIGYGRGCNLGLERAATRYVLFQNPDAVVDLSAMERMVRLLDENPKAALVGPAIIGDNGILQHCGRLPTPWNVIADAAGIPTRDKPSHHIEPGEAPFRTDWLGGAVLMGRTELLKPIGGFDPRIFLYFDETDLCKRVGDLGHELWACGEAVTRHVVHASARGTGRALYNGAIAEHFFRSRYYYLTRHHGRIAATTAELIELAFFGLRVVKKKLFRQPTENFGLRFRCPILRMPVFPV